MLTHAGLTTLSIVCSRNKIVPKLSIHKINHVDPKQHDLKQKQGKAVRFSKNHTRDHRVKHFGTPSLSATRHDVLQRFLLHNRNRFLKPTRFVKSVKGSMGEKLYPDSVEEIESILCYFGSGHMGGSAAKKAALDRIRSCGLEALSGFSKILTRELFESNDLVLSSYFKDVASQPTGFYSQLSDLQQENVHEGVSSLIGQNYPGVNPGSISISPEMHHYQEDLVILRDFVSYFLYYFKEIYHTKPEILDFVYLPFSGREFGPNPSGHFNRVNYTLYPSTSIKQLLRFLGDPHFQGLGYLAFMRDNLYPSVLGFLPAILTRNSYFLPNYSDSAIQALKSQYFSVNPWINYCAFKALLSADTLLLWLEASGFVPTGHLDWLSTMLCDFHLSHVSMTYEKRLKYLTTLVQFNLLDQSRELPRMSIHDIGPDRPSCVRMTEVHFLRGAAYSWFSARTNPMSRLRNKQSFLELVNSITTIKKRQPSMPELFLQNSTDDWYNSLFHKNVSDARFIAGTVGIPLIEREIPLGRSRVDFTRNIGLSTSELHSLLIDTIRSVVNPLVRKAVDIGLHFQTIPFPSSRSRIGLPVKVGGHLAGVLASVSSGYRFDPLLIRSESGHPGAPLVSLEHFPQSCLWKGQTYSFDRVPRTDRVSTVEVGTFHGTPQGSTTLTCDIMEDYLGFYSGIDPSKDLYVKPVALAEPLKVRMISTSVGDQYYLVQAFQKFLHKMINLRKEFRATREDPLIGENLSWVFNQNIPTRHLDDDEFYVSGDYKASTDNLDPLLSELILEQIFDSYESSTSTKINPESRSLLLRTLTGHKTDQGTPQVWGQLMGSPTSFPILCLANFILFAVSKRLCSKKLRHSFHGSENLAVMINGDDIGFLGNPRLYAVWKSVTSKYGLALSPGKNFVSRDFLQLNSQMFCVSDSDDDLSITRSWKRVTCFNIATLSPPRKVLFNEFFELAPALEATFLDTTTGQERDRLNSIFLRIWHRHLMKVSPFMNWFFPRALGGLGLEYTSSDPFEQHCTEAHLRAASYIRSTKTDLTKHILMTKHNAGSMIEKRALSGPMHLKDNNVNSLVQSVLIQLADKGYIQRDFEDPEVVDRQPFDPSLDLYAFLSGNVQIDTPLINREGSLEPQLPLVRRRIVVDKSGSHVRMDTVQDCVREVQSLNRQNDPWLSEIFVKLRKFSRLVSNDRVMLPDSVLKFGERKLRWFLTRGVSFDSAPGIKLNVFDIRNKKVDYTPYVSGQYLDSKLPVSLTPVCLLTDLEDDREFEFPV